MRRFLILLIAIVPAFGQWRHFGQGQYQWAPAGFVGIGGSTAINPLAKQLDAGWNLAGGVGVTRGYTGLMFDAMYTGFGVTHSALAAQGARSGYERFWALTVDPVVHVNPRGPADFYLTGGAGLYGEHISFRAPASLAGPAAQYDLIRSDTLYKPGANIGAGFAFNVSRDSRLKFFAEARLHHLFNQDSGSSFIPVTVGVRF